MSAIIERLEAIAARIKYKPWVDLAYEFDYDITTQGVRVMMRTRVPDSTVTSQDNPRWLMSRIQVINDDWLPLEFFDVMDDDKIIDYLYMLLSQFEQHEQAEWFQVDGKRKYNPHEGD